MKNTRAKLIEMTKQLSAEYPIIANGLLANQLKDDDPKWKWAELAIDHVQVITENDPERIEACLDAFAFTSIDFLRLQARFQKTGKYARTTSDGLLEELYDSDEEMQPYLDGLALTYAMWPNHSALLGFFVEEYLPALPRNARILEIGPGHGLFARTALNYRDDISYVGLDISPSSVAYSSAALAASEIDPARYELSIGDATAPDILRNLDSNAFDALICCEVLEHVDKPTELLSGMRHSLTPEALAFLTTVANLEATDHVYLFKDASEIVSSIDLAGYKMLKELALALPGSEAMTPLPLNFACIATS